MGRRSAAFAVLVAMWLGGCGSTGPTGSSAPLPPVDAAAEASEDAGTPDATLPDADSAAPLYT